VPVGSPVTMSGWLGGVPRSEMGLFVKNRVSGLVSEVLVPAGAYVGKRT
jgi:hypothetical protein